ncbi:MAG: hypothetical protein WC422_05185 [Candidatus Paceibacterota bacterium]|jgi:hypothetical protein
MNNINLFPKLTGLGIGAHDCIFPEEIDREFTENIALSVYNLRKTLMPGIVITGFSIKEQFINERDPHYRSEFEFTSDNDAPDHDCACFLRKRISYVAKKDGKEYQGIVDIGFSYTSCAIGSDFFSCFLFGLFRLYNEAILKFYPEWETTYDLSVFLF